MRFLKQYPLHHVPNLSCCHLSKSSIMFCNPSNHQLSNFIRQLLICPSHILCCQKNRIGYLCHVKCLLFITALQNLKFLRFHCPSILPDKTQLLQYYKVEQAYSLSSLFFSSHFLIRNWQFPSCPFTFGIFLTSIKLTLPTLLNHYSPPTGWT